jgi:hypothetical protein
MRVPLYIITICGMLWPVFGSAQGAFVNGNYLFDACHVDENSNSSQWTTCSAYIAGVIDGLTLTKSADGLALINNVCRPNDTVLKQSMDVVLTYLRAHPEARHYSASSLIATALKQAFPCNR